MRNICEVKTQDDIQKVFSMATKGESVIISNGTNTNFVLLPESTFSKLNDTLYFAKIDKSIKQMEDGNVVIKTIEELEAMEK